MEDQSLTFLGMFAKLWKGTTSFVESISLSLHRKARPSVDGLA